MGLMHYSIFIFVVARSFKVHHFSLSTMAAFGDFCPKSISHKSQFQAPNQSYFTPNSNKSEKKGTFVMSILNIDYLVATYIFSFFNSLVPKIDICLKYFLDKNSQKQPLCVWKNFRVTKLRNQWLCLRLVQWGQSLFEFLY